MCGGAFVCGLWKSLSGSLCTMLKGDRSFHRRWEIVLADNKTSVKKPPFYIRWFVPILVLLGIAGGAAALLVPSGTDWLRQSGLSGEAEQKSISDLRLHFLYITGGIIAILTLLQTNWKNQVDRLKIDADIKKNEQDAEKNERDHIRQVHAERRSRYTKAVEQLANEKAAVRLGGIYTLVGLVDEWLADDTLDPEEQRKEGQVIINNLCSYIRSPFPLAAKIEEYEAHKKLEELKKKESENALIGAEPFTLKVLSGRFTNTQNYKKPEDITTDYAKFHEEQDVRRTIFVEMSKRSSSFSRNEKGDVFKTTRRTWSDFDFDFSRAPIFYPLNEITIEKGNFSSAKFYSSADFRWAKFAQTADFSWVTFTQDAYFFGAKFAQTADFHGATFTQNAGFIGAKFTQTADFHGATFTQTVNFIEATFTNNVDFRQTTFERFEPIFTIESKKARFSTDINWQGSDFSVTLGNTSINCGTASLLGKSFTIPLGTVLFDPTSWDEQKKVYTRVSEPAK